MIMKNLLINTYLRNQGLTVTQRSLRREKTLYLKSLPKGTAIALVRILVDMMKMMKAMQLMMKVIMMMMDQTMIKDREQIQKITRKMMKYLMMIASLK